jgi:hypothetical protein
VVVVYLVDMAVFVCVVAVMVVVDGDDYDDYDTGRMEDFCLRKEVCLDFDFP